MEKILESFPEDVRWFVMRNELNHEKETLIAEIALFEATKQEFFEILRWQGRYDKALKGLETSVSPVMRFIRHFENRSPAFEDIKRWFGDPDALPDESSYDL